ncbi:toll/interleukin-1 receptor domain-containing protein [Streptomyces longwoodensis]|uniref:toll/interleukin-1 receptor domain-containing protein n=1 Tax=Streptomyces longwoodensis TaxID=68231 RepID=UPI002253201F|nr:toll/interleukin-1 receptor domain-containing protein [Streptomyces longwoodensis]MCX4996748.1 toll/interleukin-1 receptor domain-containing protein [Streptomyces longwoodensis]WUC57079.1 toll/interleukin-1 receptor domain-containing protein [Streptomyces longwoodensis]
MPHVFINYRTGDGERTAALLDQELSRRFGQDRVFRASRSITPGQAYPEALLTALHRSSVLLAVVGPDWTNFRSRLQDPEDWVRKEIETAFECGLIVVPVLDGRKTDRLSGATLPPELARLADLQSVPFDTTHDTGAGVRRIGDLISELIPELRDLDEPGEPSPASSTVHNSMGDVSGTAVQAGDFNGDVGGTIVKGSHGPVHTGSGSIYNNSRHVSGNRYISGTGTTYTEGDHHGDVHQRFGEPEQARDDRR